MGTFFIRSAAPNLLAALSVVIFCQAATARNGEAGASASILIDAPPAVVWHAVHEERMHDPDLAYVKFLEKSGNSATIEEKFTSIPIIGSVIAVLQEQETPGKRIDYSLIKSDKFKRMEGSWSLTPVSGGKQTLLRLSSFLDVGVPFSGIFIRNATQHKIDKRVGNVKRAAEKNKPGWPPRVDLKFGDGQI